GQCRSRVSGHVRELRTWGCHRDWYDHRATQREREERLRPRGASDSLKQHAIPGGDARPFPTLVECLGALEDATERASRRWLFDEHIRRAELAHTVDDALRQLDLGHVSLFLVSQRDYTPQLMRTACATPLLLA